MSSTYPPEMGEYRSDPSSIPDAALVVVVDVVVAAPVPVPVVVGAGGVGVMPPAPAAVVVVFSLVGADVVTGGVVVFVLVAGEGVVVVMAEEGLVALVMAAAAGLGVSDRERERPGHTTGYAYDRTTRKKSKRSTFQDILMQIKRVHVNFTDSKEKKKKKDESLVVSICFRLMFDLYFYILFAP